MYVCMYVCMCVYICVALQRAHFLKFVSESTAYFDVRRNIFDSVFH